MTTTDKDTLATGELRAPLNPLRILCQPQWVVNDLAPMPVELRNPLEYVRGVWLWRRVRQDGYTMLGCRRGRTLHRLAVQVERTGVPGAIVDCGVWNGGSTAMMAAGAPTRTAWAFDSFVGLPEPGGEDGEGAEGWAGSCLGREESVRNAFIRYANADQLRIVKGWFEDTLASTADEIGPIAVLHADGDWYDSVKLTLDVLVAQVSPGGWVVVDDYSVWSGARKAVDDFRRDRRIRTPLLRAEASAYWQVSA
jgi:O-methyltransferase